MNAEQEALALISLMRELARIGQLTIVIRFNVEPLARLEHATGEIVEMKGESLHEVLRALRTDAREAYGV